MKRHELNYERKNGALRDMADQNQLLKKRHECSKARVKKMEMDSAQLELDMQSDSSDEEACDSDPKLVS